MEFDDMPKKRFPLVSWWKYFYVPWLRWIKYFFVKIFPALFYILWAIIILRGVLFSPGIIWGSDWGLPLTGDQIHEYFVNGFFTWTNQWNLFGRQQPFSTSLWFQGLMWLGSLIGLSGQYFLKVWLGSLFVLGGCSMYAFARFLKCGKTASLIGGLALISTPVFFDYSIMGWTYVLFSLSILPLTVIFFIKSVRENKISYSLVTGILFALAAIQSQSFVWYPLVFGALFLYLVENKSTLWFYVRSLMIVLAVCLALHAMWLLPLLIYPVQSILGSGLINNEMSRGTWVHLSYLNLIRLWGVVVNYQYERVHQGVFEAFSFIVPAVVALAMLLYKKNKLVISLVCVFVMPAILFTLGPGVIARLPLASLVRDIARFSVLSSFAYASLLALLLHFLFRSRIRYFKILGFFICLAVVVNTLPFFLGYIVGQPTVGSDIRLRTYAFPEENLQVENLMNNMRLERKDLYLPVGEVMEIKNDSRFNGIFRGARDIFAGFAHHPSSVTSYESGLGSPPPLVFELGKVLDNKQFSELGKVFSLFNIRYLIFRKDVEYTSSNNVDFIYELKKQIYTKELFEKRFSNHIIIQNNYFLPHFYVSQKNIISGKSANSLFDIVANPNYEIRSAIFFNEQNVENNDVLNNLASSIDGKQVMEYKKINQTKYKIIIHGASGQFPLVFSESFHRGWKAFLVRASNSRVSLSNPIFLSPASSITQPSNYTTGNNKDDQVSREELLDYIYRGWVTSLGNSNRINFISKNFQGTIQNDNLINDSVWGTWFSSGANNIHPELKKIFAFNKNIVQLPENSHLVANGYANSWIIEANIFCSRTPGFCRKNLDGTFEMELIVEFIPQRLFYLGLLISVTTLFICFVYFIYVWQKQRR